MNLKVPHDLNAWFLAGGLNSGGSGNFGTWGLAGRSGLLWRGAWGGVDYSRILPASLLRVYCDETAVFCHASLH